MPPYRLFAVPSLVALLATAAPAQAEGPKITATAGAASDYVFRGVSQTDSRPFGFGAFDLSAGAFYAGFGAENVDFGNSIDAEYDLYAGWRPKVGLATLDLGVVRYGYTNQPAGVDIDTVELKAGVSLPIAGGAVGGLAAWTDDYFGSGDSGTYIEANATAPLAGWILAGAIGRQGIAAGGDYTTWNLGASRAFGRLVLDLRYHDTGAHERGDVWSSRAVATLKTTF